MHEKNIYGIWKKYTFLQNCIYILQTSEYQILNSIRFMVFVIETMV